MGTLTIKNGLLSKSVTKSEKGIKKGKTLKCEERIDPFLYSPSGDEYFSHPENIRAINEGMEQIKRGEYVTLTAKEIRESLGL
ncbi:hypothetical protein EZS27_023198 [termite gut metagenome]|uniref:Uncharacterized protein n=1 Tax=termite gut metagenome TaxID=433724 RepID=A0A5J4R2S2_9ZZZZ